MEKQAIIDRIIEEQERIILDIEKSIEMYKTTSDIDEDNTLDPEDYSHQTEAQEMQMRMEQKLKAEKLALDFLKSRRRNSYTRIEPGAILETEKNYLYLGVSIHPFMVNNKEVLCISEKAPIINNLKNKRVGDIIKLGELSQTILSIS